MDLFGLMLFGTLACTAVVSLGTSSIWPRGWIRGLIFGVSPMVLVSVTWALGAQALISEVGPQPGNSDGMPPQTIGSVWRVWGVWFVFIVGCWVVGSGIGTTARRALGLVSSPQSTERPDKVR